jgi:hypothetical protein
MSPLRYLNKKTNEIPGDYLAAPSSKPRAAKAAWGEQPC